MRYLSIILISLFLFSSCQKEEFLVEQSLYVSFSVSPDTRATNELMRFEPGDEVGVYVLDKTVNASAALKPVGNYADNKRFVWDEAKHAFIASDRDNLIFNAPDKKLEFYVYYPYQRQVTDATNLLHVIQGTGKQDDFLFGINNEYSGSKTIPVTFRHLLSRVDIRYTSTENRDATKMSVNTYTDLKINLASGTVATVTNRRVAISLEKQLLPDCASFTGIVAPQTWNVGEQFAELSYSGGGSYPFSFSTARTFLPNSHNEVFFMPKSPVYEFNVTPNPINVAALSNNPYSFSLLSEKSQAINGVKLPNTTTNIGYTVNEQSDWINVQGNSFTVAENRDLAIRTGKVVFKQDESDYLVELVVYQEAGTVTNDYTFTFDNGGLATSWSGVASSGASRTFSIVSTKQISINGTFERSENTSYTATSTVNWITISGATITVGNNESTTPRGGVVTFTQTESGKTIKVTITQLKKSSVDIN